jgi:hypothetical protein
MSTETISASGGLPASLNVTSVCMVGTNAIAGSVSNTGLWYSSNSGQTWAQSNKTNDDFYSVYMAGTNAIACSQSGTGLWYSSDSGQTWLQSNKTDDNFWSVCMVGTNAIAGSSSGNGVWYSSDSGQTWTQSNNTNDFFYSVYMVGTNAIGGSFINTGLWYSSDSGQTWSQSNKTDNTFYTVYMVGTNAIAGSVSDTGLWYSSDSGQTWSQSNKTDTNFYSVYMVGTNAIAGSVSGVGLWYSSDSGQTWTQSNKTDNGFVSVCMVGSNAIAGSQFNSGLWYSNDSGQTWLQYSNETTRVFITVAMNTSYNLIAGGPDFIGYDLTFPCFNKGTKLLCLQNNEEVFVSIENIGLGMLVKTYGSGYVPVKYIQTKELLNDVEKPLNSMWKMKGTDFIVTGGHSILVDELTEEQMNKQLARGFEHTMQDKKLLLACYSDDFEQIKEKELFQIYHLVLENGHYGVYSENNILTETCEQNFFEKFLL